MSSISIAGNTSGTITLDAPNVAGTTTLTLPATSGTIVTTNTMPAGSILQVVQTTFTTEFSTTSTSFVSTGFAASITPSKTSSKILVMVNTQQTNITAAVDTYFTVYRGATNIGIGAQSSLARYVATSGYVITPVAISYLDSPATTSSTTYTAYFKTVATTAYVNSGYAGTITLLEVAA